MGSSPSIIHPFLNINTFGYAIIKRVFDVIIRKIRLLWAVHHDDRSGIKLHVSFTNDLGMPLKVDGTTALKHYDSVGKELEDKPFILMGDCDYFTIEKVDLYKKDGQDFVFRLKENIKLNQKRTLKGSYPKNLQVCLNLVGILSLFSLD